MPNCCFGALKISATKELVEEILELVMGVADDGTPAFDFSKVIPIPDGLSDGTKWRAENWGTTRIGFDASFNNDCLFFWTAWSPCSPVVERLAQMFPDACFDYSYDESGMGFCGEERYENGKLVYIMEADMSEHWYDDEDDLPPDFEDGHEEESRICVEENDQYRIGEFHRFHDEDICRTIVDGMFCEGTDDDLRERLYEKLYGKEPALK